MGAERVQQLALFTSCAPLSPALSGESDGTEASPAFPGSKGEVGPFASHER
jgi:hypothetical protein